MKEGICPYFDRSILLRSEVGIGYSRLAYAKNGSGAQATLKRLKIR